VFQGLTQLPGKIFSLFEPHTEIIHKGKASKPTEFGKLVQIQKAENQIITYYEVFDEGPSDRELLFPAVEAHECILGRVPRLVAADAGFFSRAQERELWTSVWSGSRCRIASTRSSERKKLEKSRWFKKAQAWRTGCEGRISVIKCRHGLGRGRYRGTEGMKRWVGLGVMADNFINIGKALMVARAWSRAAVPPAPAGAKVENAIQSSFQTGN
jgi:IS5 family transposase